MAAAVKNIAGVEYMPADEVGDGTANDIDLVFDGKSAQYPAYFAAIRISVFCNRAGVEANIPEFRQQNGIRALLHGFSQQALERFKVCVKASKLDVHL